MRFEWAEHVLGSLAFVDSKTLRFGHQGKVRSVEVLTWFPWSLKSVFLSTQRERVRGLRLKGVPC